MRPQHITAENDVLLGAHDRRRDASMRPQHITAENASPAAQRHSRRTRFNEAAAYHCGKRVEAKTFAGDDWVLQ